MSSPYYFSPLRYPGGKGKLAEFIKDIITCNHLQDGCYVEPYAGGAAVALELLLLDYVSTIWINDLNVSVHAFWDCVLNHTEELCGRILTVPLDMESWYRQKEVQAEPSRATTVELGFSTFFLNRCNRSGIINGGVIGGKDQSGPWKLDARFNREALVKRIRQIARFKSRIKLSRMDAVQFLTDPKRIFPQKTLIYLDPPYIVKSKRLYDSFYSPQDHASVATVVERLKGAKWIVSYDDEPEIRDLYSKFRRIIYSLSYSVKDRYKGREVMFFSDDLQIPEVPERSPIQLIAS